MNDLKQFIVRQKYRFDLGQSFLAVASFALLLITASDKVAPLLGIEQTRWLVLVCVPAGLASVWIFGWLLDTKLQAAQRYNRESNERNELLQQLHVYLEPWKSSREGREGSEGQK